MTYATVPVDEQGFDQLAQGLTGFSDQAQDELRKSMMTTIFISGASAQSEGRCAYMLSEKTAVVSGCLTLCAAGLLTWLW